MRFTQAAELGDPKIVAEALLKLEVCQWLVAKCGRRVQRARAAALNATRPEGEIEIELKVIADLDPLDEIANWNVGIELTKAAEHSEALPHFLVCAFRASGDTEAWTNSLLCAINMQDAAILQAVLRCALALGGPTAADEFCERMALSEEISEYLNNTIAEFNDEFGAGIRSPPTFRILSRDDIEPTVSG